MTTSTKIQKKWAAPQKNLPPQIQERNEWVEKNLGLARMVAHKWRGLSHVPYEELEQVAFIFLIKASEKFDRERGVAFSSFALKKINGGVLNWIRDRGNVIKTPRVFHDINQKAKRVERQIEAQMGRKATSVEIAFSMGLDATQLQAAKTAARDCKRLRPEEALYSQEGSSDRVRALPLSADWSALSDYEQRAVRLFFSTSNAAKILKIGNSQLQQIVTTAFAKVKVVAKMAA